MQSAGKSRPSPERGPLLALIEDDPVMGQSIVDWFTVEGYRTVWWRNGQDALAAFSQARPDAVLCDIRLPDMTGEEIFRELGARLGSCPIIFITGFGDIAQAVRLMQVGATDYVTKPFDIEAIIRRIEDALSAHWSLTEGWELGIAPAIIEVEQLLRRVAAIDSTVLLKGPSGSGKEVAARLLHRCGQRAERPFLAVNCAAIPKDLLESELFGHERGAFTGAHQRHEGFAESAGSGTLFFDEVAELPLELQAKLLRLLQEKSFRRVGGDKLLPFRARVVAATNADIERHVRDGRFREDLYYRLAVISVDMPPLKSRVEDIVPLARRFVSEYAQSFGRTIRGLSPQAEKDLLTHGFPGNMRELRNRIERAVALSDRDWLTTSDLFPERRLGEPTFESTSRTLADAREAAERALIEATLREAEGDVEKAALVLDVSRSTLFAKIKRFGIRG
ncbi:MAG: sigma-54-dependent transcriptional regulator [Hyphomicrobiaceae bacterium]